MGVPTVPDFLTNLISAWPGNGNTNDVYGTNNGTGEGSLSYGSGLNGYQAFSGNGSSCYVVSANTVNPVLFAGYSFSAWFNTTTSGFPIVYMDQNPLAAGTIYDKVFGINTSGNIYFAIFNGSAYAILSTGKNYLDGVWHHAVVTSNNTNVSQIYVDGTIVASGLGNGSNYAGYWKLGMNHYTSYPIGTAPASPFYFSGLLQDLRYYGAVLTGPQVTTLYQNGPRIA